MNTENKITYIIHKYAGNDEDRRFDVYNSMADEVRTFKNKQDEVGITIVFDSVLSPGDRVLVTPEYGTPFEGEYCREYTDTVIVLLDNGDTVKVDSENVKAI